MAALPPDASAVNRARPIADARDPGQTTHARRDERLTATPAPAAASAAARHYHWADLMRWTFGFDVLPQPPLMLPIVSGPAAIDERWDRETTFRHAAEHRTVLDRTGRGAWTDMWVAAAPLAMIAFALKVLHIRPIRTSSPAGPAVAGTAATGTRA